MILVANKKVHLEYKIEEKLVFGVELLGPEVKSLRNKQGSLEGAKIVNIGSRLQLVGAFIPVYQPKNNQKLDPERTRNILANKKEIREIIMLHHGKNNFCFPIAFFTSGKFVKLECGIGPRLKKVNKREVIRDKDDKRKDL